MCQVYEIKLPDALTLGAVPFTIKYWEAMLPWLLRFRIEILVITLG